MELIHIKPDGGVYGEVVGALKGDGAGVSAQLGHTRAACVDAVEETGRAAGKLAGQAWLFRVPVGFLIANNEWRIVHEVLYYLFTIRYSLFDHDKDRPTKNQAQ